MKQAQMNQIIVACFALIMSGCAAVGPDYIAPESEFSDEWNLTNNTFNTDQQLQQDWWTILNDPKLDEYIRVAAENNRNVLAAIAKVEEARARFGIATGQLYPEARVEGSTVRTRTSENSTGSKIEETYYSSGIGASWELDLFGRIRRSVEAADAQYQATQEEYNQVMVSLYSEVARTYIEIRTTQVRLASANKNITSQKELLKLTHSRFGHGLATDLDVAQAERLLARAESEVPPLKVSLSEGINGLSVLLGQLPGALHDELLEAHIIPLPPEQVDVGVPADLLRRRPDIRLAERNLAAETARIGVATADLYPSFSLIGTFGFESIDAGDLFDAGSKVFSFGPSLRWQIFSGGRVRNQIKAQDAVTQQALHRYEQSVLNGLLEVENSMKAYIEDRVRLAALERSVVAARRSVKLSTKLYKEGLVDFQPVLDAQRDQFNFENQEALARGNSAANFVRLYTSLGGGWQWAEFQEDHNELDRKNLKSQALSAN